MKKYTLKLASVLMATWLAGCQGWWSDKDGFDYIAPPDYSINIIEFVPVLPSFTANFVKPVQVFAGFDNLLYVADNGSEQIICIDEAGREMGRFTVPGVKYVVQDRKLDLLAIGHFDTLGLRLPAIYRIRQITANAKSIDLNNAQIVTRIVHPFYPLADGFKLVTNVNQVGGGPNTQATLFNSIVVMPDNSYFVARQGSGNYFSTGAINSVIRFKSNDEYNGYVSISGRSGGLFQSYFEEQPPLDLRGVLNANRSQFSPFDNLSYTDQSFGVTTLAANQVLKYKYFKYTPEQGEASENWVLTEYAADTSLSTGYIYQPNKFRSPISIAYTAEGGSNEYVFIVDYFKGVGAAGEVDSSLIYSFTTSGLEGIVPPPTASSPRYVVATIKLATQVGGIAHFNRTLYVPDVTNKRILRYKLTTDLSE